MADHRALSHQANPIFIYPALHQLQGQVQHVACFSVFAPLRHLPMCVVSQNPDVAGDDQQGGHWEGVPRPVTMAGDMQHPRQIDAQNYNVAHCHPPPPPVSDSH